MSLETSSRSPASNAWGLRWSAHSGWRRGGRYCSSPSEAIKDHGNRGRGRGGADVGALGPERKLELIKVLVQTAGDEHMKTLMMTAGWIELPQRMLQWGFTRSHFALAQNILNRTKEAAAAVADDEDAEAARTALDEAAGVFIREYFDLEANPALDRLMEMNAEERATVARIHTAWKTRGWGYGYSTNEVDSLHTIVTAIAQRKSEANVAAGATVASTADALIEILGPACVDRARAVARTGFNEASRLRITKLLALWREADDNAGREVARTEAVHLLQAAEAELKRKEASAATTVAATADALIEILGPACVD